LGRLNTLEDDAWSLAFNGMEDLDRYKQAKIADICLSIIEDYLGASVIVCYPVLIE
jgi:hypothetical protein